VDIEADRSHGGSGPFSGRRRPEQRKWRRGRHGVALGLAATLGCIAMSVIPIAARASGTCANEQVRAESHSTSLPDCRAYELVTPAYKEGHPVTLESSHISPGGSRVIASSLGAFAGTEDNPPGEEFLGGAIYELSRSLAGWVTKPIVPPASQFTEDEFGHQLVSSDFGTTTFVLNTASQFVQQRDLYLRLPTGSFVRVGPMTPPGAANNNDARPEGGSNDLSHVMFELEQSRWPGDTTSFTEGAGPPSLYELIMGQGSEEPKLVGVKNNGALVSNAEAQLVGNCGTVLGGRKEAGQRHAVLANAVSSSGATVFFTTFVCEGSPSVNELYARLNASKTVPISEPAISVPGRKCTSTCKEYENEENGHKRSEGFFEGASEDGSKVFFTTAQPLSDSDTDTTPDLYEAEITSSGMQKLIQVSKGDSSDPTQGNGAQVLGVSAISKDGSRVYFVAEGVLTTTKNSQGQEAVKGVPNLYMAEPASGHTAFIAALLQSDNEDWEPGGERMPGGEPVKATPDGRFLVFGSAGQIFEYDSQTGTLVRVASNGRAPRVSNDGSYVFFMSRAALTPQAVNGSRHVYEYHNGQVALISDGQDGQGEGAGLLGIDASGENVFFRTVDSLVPQDTDTQTDIYDARIGGGFPAPVPPVGCSGDGCLGSPSVAPTLLTAGSVTQSGGGNLVVSAGPKGGPAQLTRAQKLAKALTVCRHKPKKKRPACEKQARRAYGPARNAKKSHKGGK
jgi:uncharacterized membrane protein